MGWQAVVNMLLDAVVSLPRLFLRIDMNHHERKILEVVQQLVPDLFGNRMRRRKSNLRGQRYIHFRMQPVAKPACANIRHIFDPSYV